MQEQTNTGNAAPAVDYNPLAPGFDANPYPAYQQLREQAPVHYWEKGRGWLVSRYEDVLSVIRDSRFTSNRADWELASSFGGLALVPEFEELSKNSLLSVSNKDHTRLRKLVSPAFTPRAIERLRPEIQRIVDETLETTTAGDTYDIARDFSELIPLRVISSMLKISKEGEPVFRRLAEAVIYLVIASGGMLTPEEAPRLREHVREGVALINDLIEDRRKNPIENDMLTTLIQTEEQGDKLTKSELVSLVSALIVAGSETTVHLIDFMVLNLLRSPELLAQVKESPELLRNAVDEVLRYDFFGKNGITRFAAEDVELAGVRIKKGQMVMLMLGSALRDGAMFSDADKFELKRDNGANIAFGNGAHYCLGANLARLEGEIAVGTLLRKFPEIKLKGEPVYAPHPGIRKIDSLKVSLRSSDA